MKANRIHQFGGPEVIHFEETPRQEPARGQILVRVKATGVGPWDAWVRSGTSALPQPLPLTLGADLSGVVAQVGPGVLAVRAGQEVFGVTNAQFVGANAEYAVAEASMTALKPRGLSFLVAASFPVVAVTAWQMLHQFAQVVSGQTVLVQGAAGNVGGYAVQLARLAGAHVVGTALAGDVDHVRTLGADRVIDVTSSRFEDAVGGVDVVIDTLGGEVQQRSLDVLRPGGILVSSVSRPDAADVARRGVRAVFLLVDVTTEALTRIGALFEAGDLRSCVGTVLPLAEGRAAHELMASHGRRPRGKIVLDAET